MGALTLNAQLYINEVCSDNESIISDSEGDFEDWIEIYNNSSNSINLQGYQLSDDEAIPDKWIFPNIEVPANSFLLVFASDKDFTGQYVHTNFKISKEGESISLRNPQSELIDRVDVPPLPEDQSYGRQPDGSAVFNFLLEPSPLGTNNNSTSYNFANPPVIHNTSFYNDQSITVQLSCDQADCLIYYTRDGNIPDENALLYHEPIILDSTTSIRAISITPSLLASEPVSRTFFIKDKHQLPVIALTTAPDNLWDWETGILVKGPEADSVYPFYGANYWKDIEVPVHMEYLVEEELKVEYPLGLKTHGGKGARTKPLKSMRLLAKNEFGTFVMDYPFFYNKNIRDFKRLVLRNASGDYHTAYMRDEFLARYFIDEQFNLDAIAEQPVVVYINGSYLGVMHLREKIDRFYLANNYGVDPDNIDLLEEDTAIVEGSFDIFNVHEAYVLENDLSINENFEVAASYFDLENLADYVICQTFVNNTDWPSNNLKYWRARTDGAKWRYLLFDMDVAFGLFGWTKASENVFDIKMQREDVRMVRIFKAFLENEKYRHYFINRYADLQNTSFREEKMKAEIIRSRDELNPEMERHLIRWNKSYSRWFDQEIPILLDFAEKRPAFARQYIGEYFNLSSEDKISISTFPPEAGDIQVNTVTIPSEEMPWDAYYYNTVPIKLSVQPRVGYQFSHWESTTSSQIVSNDLSINIDPVHLAAYTAVFEHQKIAPVLHIFPNPVNDLINLQIDLDQQMEISIRIIDATGRETLSPVHRTCNTGMDRIELTSASLSPGIYFVQVTGKNLNLSEKFFKQ